MSEIQTTVADFDRSKSKRGRVNRSNNRRYYCPQCTKAFEPIGLKQHWGQVHDELAPPWYPPKEEAKDRGVWQKLQRRLTVKRDGARCRICGIGDAELKDGGTHGLHLHHIRPVDDFEDGEFQHELTNLVMVCPSHHRRLEGLSGSEQQKLIAEAGRSPVRRDIPDVLAAAGDGTADL